MSGSDGTAAPTVHAPVLLDETVAGLAVRPDGVYVDATLGGGGHARAILDRLGANGRLVGLDRDAAAVDRAGMRLADGAARVILRQANFRDLATTLDGLGIGTVDGIVMDLGFSSDQLADPDRGFSFQRPGPLDMRMDTTRGETAADVLNRLDEAALADLFRRYGEEPRARAIAAMVVERRRTAPWGDAADFAEAVARTMGGRRGRIHPATRVFQALRIAVNDELGALEAVLPQALDRLAPGGRLAVIAFHSLEDRTVKRFLRAHEGVWRAQAAGGRVWVGETPAIRLIERHAIVAGGDETARNPRARSARLRVAERI